MRPMESRIRDLLAGGIDETTLRRKARPETREDRLASFFGSAPAPANGAVADLGIAATLTLGDVLYDWCRVDPAVVEGVDFASADDVSGLFEFAHYAQRIESILSPAREGAIARLQGYVGERVLASHLQAAGHVVTFPDGPAQPGWDILVDGHPFQAKCVADAHLVLEHAARYPDIPVYAPSELHEALSGHESVHFIDGFSHEEIQHLTHESLDAGADLLDFQIPWVSIGMSALRNVGGLIGGQGDVQTFLLNVMTESAAGVGGGLAGAKAGALTLGLIFGPAGAVVGGFTGAVAGGTVGRSAARFVRSRLASDEEARVEHGAVQVLRRASDEIGAKLQALQHQGSRLEGHIRPCSSANAAVTDYFAERVAVQSQALVRRRREMRAFAENPSLLEEDPLMLSAKTAGVVVAAGVHPVGLQCEYRELISAQDALIRRRRALRLRG